MVDYSRVVYFCAVEHYAHVVAVGFLILPRPPVTHPALPDNIRWLLVRIRALLGPLRNYVIACIQILIRLQIIRFLSLTC